MKIKNLEVRLLSICLSNLKNKGLSGANGYKIVKLQSELEAISEVMEKARESIVKEFVKEGEETLDKNDSRVKEMDDKWNEVLLESTELKSCNFLTEEELMYCTEGLSFDMIRLANKFLVIQNKEVE